MSAVGLLSGLLALAALAVAFPAAFLCLQLVVGTRAAARGRVAAPTAALPARSGSVAVLMPAHDEAAGIGVAIAAVQAALGPLDRLLVVADNCSDATAAIARAAGAEVTERTDPSRRGKGYALDHGVRALAPNPPAVVVIVDADCSVTPSAIETLARRCLRDDRPVQALYLMHAPSGARLGQRIAEFAWRLKNWIRPLGSAAFGWPCQLMGTGMAFPWPLIAAAPLASGHLVEDMQLGLDLAAAGRAPVFCPDALVSSWFPTDAQATRSQRTRWEHGHLSMIAAAGPRLLGRAVARFDLSLAAMALDLMVPPLAALVLLLAALTAIGAIWWALSGHAGPFGIAAVGVGLFAAGVGRAWSGAGRDLVAPGEMLGLPLYVAAKIPVYVRLLGKRQVDWVRTKRDDRSH